MTRKSSEADLSAGQTKTVKLNAFYSGVGESLTPGSVVSLDVEEADRLIGLKAAAEFTEEVADEDGGDGEDDKTEA